MPKDVRSIRLSDELVEALQKIADKENRTLSNLIELILSKYVKRSK